MARELPAVQPVYFSDDGELVDPRTGKAIDREASDSEIVSFLRWLRGAIAQAQALDRDVQAILRERADARAEAGIRGAYTFGRGASVPGPNAGWTWDEEKVLGMLESLSAGGLIDAGAIDRVAPLRRKLDSKALTALIAEAKPEVATALAACKKPPTGERKVTV